MNYIILIGIALFFVAMSVRDGGPGGFIFRDGQLNARIVADDYTLRVNGTGNIDLAPDASGVTALSRRGSLDVHLQRDGAERRVLYTNDDGAVRRQFFVAGGEEAWGPEADRFVAEAMPIVLRETALDAEERVAWLLENRGQNGLLDEIELIDSDFAQRVFSIEYAKAAAIAPADFDRLMHIAEDNLSSDFEMRLALAPLVARVELADDLVARSIEVAGRELNSDFELRVLLAAAASRVGTSDALARAYASAAASIDSDFEHRLALHALAGGAKLSPDGWRLLLESAQEIGSDFECATLLQTVAPQLPRGEAVVAAYRATLNTIESDFERQRAAAALLTAGLL